MYWTPGGLILSQWLFKCPLKCALAVLAGVHLVILLCQLVFNGGWSSGVWHVSRAATITSWFNSLCILTYHKSDSIIIFMVIPRILLAKMFLYWIGWNSLQFKVTKHAIFHQGVVLKKNIILCHKYSTYLHKTSSIIRANLHLSSLIMIKVSLFDYVIYSHTQRIAKV